MIKGLIYIFFRMRKLNTVIVGDFPEGSSISLINTTKGYDVEIRYYRGSSLHRFLLSGNVSDMGIVRRQSSDGSLSALESGIIGGSIASMPGFLGAYLTAKEADAVIFYCTLKDGRSFYGYCTRMFYEKAAGTVLKRNRLQARGCLFPALMLPVMIFKKIF